MPKCRLTDVFAYHHSGVCWSSGSSGRWRVNVKNSPVILSCFDRKSVSCLQFLNYCPLVDKIAYTPDFWKLKHYLSSDSPINTSLKSTLWIQKHEMKSLIKLIHKTGNTCPKRGIACVNVDYFWLQAKGVCVCVCVYTSVWQLLQKNPEALHYRRGDVVGVNLHHRDRLTPPKHPICQHTNTIFRCRTMLILWAHGAALTPHSKNKMWKLCSRCLMQLVFI